MYTLKTLLVSLFEAYKCDEACWYGAIMVTCLPCFIEISEC